MTLTSGASPADTLPGAFAARATLHDGVRPWSPVALQPEIDALAQRLRDRAVRVLATLLDNGPAWVVADLAAARAGVVHVPLPGFFSAAQLAHALQAAAADALLLPAPAAPAFAGAGAGGWHAEPWPVAAAPLALLRRELAPAALPPGTAKITFTSGSTGAPKGVCLGGTALRQVAAGVVQALAPLHITHHLCALPLAVLLENVAGLQAALLQGTEREIRCTVLPLQALGLTGSSQFDAACFDAAVRQHRPDSLILLPQMLRAWAGHLLQRGETAVDSLKFVAVGGAAVGAPTLLAARRAGIPAYEGYGLSEGGSVQTLNLPGADRPGSAGRPLPHARLRVAPDGEILISGSLFLGYLSNDAATPPASGDWPTGDLGRIDADGFVHVQGRKSHLLITAYGRNVSPEWVETALRGEPLLAQAVVFGDGRPALSAVLWPTVADAPDAALQAAVERANATLPDYARVAAWVRAAAPFSAASGFATTNGRPQRGAILRAHAAALGLDLAPAA